MTMIVDDLRNLGLPKNSAIVMDHLLHSGETKANEIVKKLGIHRHLIYEALRDLESRKLVKRISKGGVAHFRLLEAGSLVKEAEQKHERAIEIARRVKEHTSGHDSTVEFFEGVEGIDAFTSFALEQKTPIHIIGANLQFRDTFPEIVELWNEKRANLGIHLKALIPKNVSQDNLQHVKRFTYRALDVQSSPTVTWIMGDYIAHILWSTRRDTEIIMINNPMLAEQQRRFFRYMWDKAK